MTGIKKLIRDNPTILIAAIRQVLLAFVLLGFPLTEAEIIAVMLAVEAVLSAINWVLVTPNAKFNAAVNSEAANIATAIAADQDKLTDEEIASLERQIARLNADFKRESGRGI